MCKIGNSALLDFSSYTWFCFLFHMHHCDCLDSFGLWQNWFLVVFFFIFFGRDEAVQTKFCLASCKPVLRSKLEEVYQEGGEES